MCTQRTSKYCLLVLCAVATAIFEAPPACAQAAADASARTASQAVGSGLLDEVVVTARKRVERVQETPVSVTALNAAQLEAKGIDSTRTLQFATPGLTWGENGAYAQPRIRGIGTTSVQIGDESSVAVYVDGVYQPDGLVAVMSFPDVKNIEVLKGPQGTLFGRNANGGAINIITREPSLTEATGDFSAAYASFNDVNLRGHVSIPLNSIAALSLSAYRDNSDGYIRNTFLGRDVAGNDEWGLRAKLLLEPFDRLKVTLSGNYSHTSNLLALNPSIIGGNTIVAAIDPTAQIATKPYTTSQYQEPAFPVLLYGGSLRVDYDFGTMTFLSLSSGSYDQVDGHSDFGYGPIPIEANYALVPSKSFTQEFQLSAEPGARIQWVAGVFGYYNKNSYQPAVFINQFLTSTVKTRAGAAYGEATWPLVGGLSLVTGVRYSLEHKDNSGSAGLVGGPTLLTLPDTAKSWGNTTPRAILQYIAPELVNVYGSFSRGFKSGVFNSALLNGVPVSPETLSAYEIGVKSLVPGPLRGSIAIFHYDYKNIQVSSTATNSSGQVTFFQIQNAGAARVNGAEAETQLVLGMFNANAFLSYTDGKYTDFPSASGYVPTGFGGNASATLDATGNRLPNTPKLSFGAGASYSFDVPRGQATLSANVFHSSSYFFEATNRLKQDAYTIVNASLSWKVAQHYTLSVYGENLTDRAYLVGTQESTLGDFGAWAPPRVVGGRIEYTFGD